MTNSTQVAALRVADEAFLVASTIERCPKTMMIRELFMNAVEAAVQAKEGSRLIEIKMKNVKGIQKLCIWNSGPGMSSIELHHMCDIAASIGKEKGLDENFGMGAKVASLPSNKFGLRYRSCKDEIVSEVILCERDGVYGRLKRNNDGAPSIKLSMLPKCRGRQATIYQKIGQKWCCLEIGSNRTRFAIRTMAILLYQGSGSPIISTIASTDYRKG